MLVTLVYLYGAIIGALPFDPWWVAGFGFVDVILIDQISDLIHGGPDEPFLNFEASKGGS